MLLSPSRIIKEFSSGIILTELIYNANESLTNHAHEEGVFCVSLEGSCSETYLQKVREYPPFVFEYLPPYESHSVVTSSAGMRSFNIKLSPNWLAKAEKYSLRIGEYLYSKGGNIGHLMMKMYQEFQNTDAASPLSIEGIAFEMIAEVSRFQEKIATEIYPPCWLKKAKEYLRANFRENPSLLLIAQAVDIHPTHLSREFSRYYGCKTGEYIRQLRIEYASHQLIASEIPLTQIALSAGFSDQSHFSRIFKRETGNSPSEFRKTHSKS